MPLVRPAALVVSLVAALALSGCGSGEPTVSISDGPVAESAPENGAQLGLEEFAAALKRDGTTLVDVRTPQEYAEGHVPGAVNIDLQSPQFADDLATLDPAGTYAVYCRSGNRSAVAVEQMTAMGFTSAYDLAGGFVDWQEAGGEVATGESGED